MIMMLEEDAIDDDWFAPERTIREKKAEIKEMLENDIELLNEIILDIRKDKIDKIKNKH